MDCRSYRHRCSYYYSSVAFSGFFGQNFNLHLINGKPTVTITYPSNGATVARLVMISGTASDPDKEDNISSVEVKIGENDWATATGTTLWSYDWTTYTSPEWRIHDQRTLLRWQRLLRDKINHAHG